MATKPKFKIVDNTPRGAIIKVVGVGGAGGNAVKHMIDKGIGGVDFYCVNTDAQDLLKLEPHEQQDMLTAYSSVNCLQVGKELTKGLGAGADPDVGRKAAMEDEERIGEMIDNTDMLFIAAGMGGGTGTGAAPVVAAIAKKKGILTVAVVTSPFSHENRAAAAASGLSELTKHVDTVIIVSNDKLLAELGSKVSLLDAFAAANDVLFGAVQGIADLIIRPGTMNVDFADVQSVMLGKGNAMMGTGVASGENRAAKATADAIRSPLLEDIALNSASGLLVNITANEDVTIGEHQEICALIRDDYAARDARIVVGTVIDQSMADMIKVTVVATGVFSPSHQPDLNDTLDQNNSESSQEWGMPHESAGALSGLSGPQPASPVMNAANGGVQSGSPTMQMPASGGQDMSADYGIDYTKLQSSSFSRMRGG